MSMTTDWRRKFGTFVTPLAVLALLSAGCGDDDDDDGLDGGLDAAADAAGDGAVTDAPRDTMAADAATDGRDMAAGEAGATDMAGDAAANTAAVRVVHAAPGAPAVDVYAMGSAMPLVRNLMYGQATPYSTVPAGSYVREIRMAGAAATSAPLYTSPAVMLAAGSQVTVVAAGVVGSMAADMSFRLLPLVDGFAMPAANTARVRLVHASPDAPTVGIDVGNNGTAELMLDRFAASPAGGVELPAGMPVRVGILAGMPAMQVATFTTPALMAGAQLYVIATGLVGARPGAADAFSLLVVTPTAAQSIEQDPVVYALHASPDAPAVDIFVGQTEVVENLAFGALSSGLRVSPGMYTLDFFATAAGPNRPAGMPAASAMLPMLMAGERYLAIATGFLTPTGMDEPMFRVLPVQENFMAEATMARLRVVHASPDAPAVDVGAVGMAGFMAVPGLTNLMFGGASAEVVLAPGQVVLGVAPTGMTTTVAQFPVTLMAGMRVFAVAAGALTPAADEQAFRLLLVNTAASPWTVSAVMPQAN